MNTEPHARVAARSYLLLALSLLPTSACGEGYFSDGDRFAVTSGDCSTTQPDSTTTPYSVVFSSFVDEPWSPEGCIGTLIMEFNYCWSCAPTTCRMCVRPLGDSYELLHPVTFNDFGFCSSGDWRQSTSASYGFSGQISAGNAEVDGDMLELQLTVDGIGGLGGFEGRDLHSPTTMTCSITAIRE